MENFDFKRNTTTYTGNLTNIDNSINNLRRGYNVKDAGLVGDGTADDYTKLNTLLTSIGSNSYDLYFPTGTYKLSTSITFPTNIRLIIANGAMLSPDNGTTITINGEIEAGLYQIFTGLGSIGGILRSKALFVEWFGAVENMESTSAIQKAFDSASLGYTVYFSKIYITSSLLTISKTLNLVGKSKYTSGIKNIGIGTSAIVVLDAIERGTIRDMRIFGNGTTSKGADATTLHGLVFENDYIWNVDNCWFRGHGGHGIYFEKGHWTTTINKCEIEWCKLDGINAVAQGIAGNQQVNAISITNCHLAGNGRNGLNAWGNNVNVLHNIIEGNNNSGIIMSYDFVGSATSALNINIHYNYFELNGDGFINTKSRVSTLNAIANISIRHNYGYMDLANMNGGITYVCNFTGEGSLSSPSLQKLNFGKNYFYCTGGLNIANFNSLLSWNSYVEIEESTLTQYANFGGATVLQKKFKTIQGYLFAKGLTYASISLSDAAAVPSNVLFPSMLNSNELITQLGIWVDTDHTAFQIKFQVFTKPYNTNAAYTKTTEFTVNGTATGYLTTGTVDQIGTIDAKRLVSPNYDSYVNINIVSASGGTYLKLGNLTLTYC